MKGWNLQVVESAGIVVHLKIMELTEDLGLDLGSTNSFTLGKLLHFSDPFFLIPRR